MEGLISMLAHDLRTPLSAISGWLFLLESGKLDAEAQKRAVAKIRTAVEEQVQLIDDALLLSQSESGRLRIEPAPIAAVVPLAAAIADAQAQAAAKGVRIGADTSQAELGIEADQARLQRAFSLVLAHALKFTPANGQIGVTATRNNGRLQIGISHTGAYGTATEMAQLLDPSRRLYEASGQKARGPDRALLVANALIVAHGGRLAARAGGDQGETLMIDLPLTADSRNGNDRGQQ